MCPQTAHSALPLMVIPCSSILQLSLNLSCCQLASEPRMLDRSRALVLGGQGSCCGMSKQAGRDPSCAADACSFRLGRSLSMTGCLKPPARLVPCPAVCCAGSAKARQRAGQGPHRVVQLHAVNSRSHHALSQHNGLGRLILLDRPVATDAHQLSEEGVQTLHTAAPNLWGLSRIRGGQPVDMHHQQREGKAHKIAGQDECLDA